MIGPDHANTPEFVEEITLAQANLESPSAGQRRLYPADIWVRVQWGWQDRRADDHRAVGVQADRFVGVGWSGDGALLRVVCSFWNDGWNHLGLDGSSSIALPD